MLQTGDGFVTTSLAVRSSGRGWSRRLLLVRTEDGWTLDASSEGDPGLPPPGGDPALLGQALDCDLGLCPLTNTMPVLRHRLHEGGGPVDFLMAWVAVPELSVHPSEQRYTFVEADGERRTVRYEGKHRSFVGDLVFDPDGLVVHYPDLATLVDRGS